MGYTGEEGAASATSAAPCGDALAPRRCRSMLRLGALVLLPDSKLGRFPVNATVDDRHRGCPRFRLDALNVAANLGGVDVPLAREALHEELVLLLVVRRALVPALDLDSHVLDGEGMREEGHVPEQRAVGVAPEPRKSLRLRFLGGIGPRVSRCYQAGDQDREQAHPLEDVERCAVRKIGVREEAVQGLALL